MRKVEGEGLEDLDPMRWMLLPPSLPNLSPWHMGSPCSLAPVFTGRRAGHSSAFPYIWSA